MVRRVMNFNAGPASLPRSVLERARDEMLDFEGSGMSIMEHSHRGKVYEAVHREAISLLRMLLGVPDSYAVLLLQGGAHQAFAQVPMNFLARGHTADYLVTGHWGERAYEEACNVGTSRLAGPDLRGAYTRIPSSDENTLNEGAAYVHITSNNTIEGTQYDRWPDTSRVPLVADMCSDFLWRPFDVTRFGVVYAGAQKNLGPAGVTIYLIRRELLDRAQTNIPKVFRFGVHEANESLYNTPPTFAIYMVRNMLQWIRDEGGLSAMEQRNRAKSASVYGAIDAHPGFYRCPVEPPSRSHMNVVFRLPDEALEARFVAEAERADMVGLKGHRSVGGIRASLYNAVTLDDARALASFMHDFAQKNG